MQIIRKLNNSAIYCSDGQNEYIVLGKGISYRTAGTELDVYPTDKVFGLKASSNSDYLLKLVEDIPIEIFDVTLKIIENARDKLTYKIDDKVFLGLLDHIACTIERTRKGIQLNNYLIWEIKRAYPQEYAIGLDAAKTLKECFGIKVGEQEAGFIALHFVNSKLDGDKYNVDQILAIVNEIVKLVYYYAPYAIDSNSMQYYRFVNHLQFLAQRILTMQEATTATVSDESNDKLFQAVSEQYGQSYKIAQKIRTLIQKKHNKYLSNDEILYLLIYIQMLIR